MRYLLTNTTGSQDEYFIMLEAIKKYQKFRVLTVEKAINKAKELRNTASVIYGYDSYVYEFLKRHTGDDGFLHKNDIMFHEGKLEIKCDGEYVISSDMLEPVCTEIKYNKE